MANMIDLDQGFPVEGPVVQMQGRVWHFAARIGARKLAEVQDGAASATNVEVIEAIQGFIRDALSPDEHGDWTRLVAEDSLDTQQILDLYKALIEAYGNRPTSASSGSSPTPSRNGTGSTVPSPSPAVPTSPSDFGTTSGGF